MYRAIWLKLAHWFLRIKFLKICPFIFIIFQLASIGKSCDHLIEYRWIPIYKRILYGVWLKLVPWFWRRDEYENVKSLQIDSQTDGHTTADQESSLELSAQMS